MESDSWIDSPLLNSLNSRNSSNEDSNKLQTLKVSTNLLTIDGVDITEDVLFPDELNNLLREKIQYFTHENGMLKKNLKDLEFQYNKCNSTISELEKKLKNHEKKSLVTSTEVAGSKIVDLTKKLREKTSEVESLKTKYSKLERKLLEANNALENKECVFDQEKVEEKLLTNELEDEVKRLKEKLNSVTNKLSETRNANMQLKNDLKLANKWLVQETGDSFMSLHTLTSNRNWRGRAQIICDLQRKNYELKEKLKSNQDSVQTVSSEYLSKTSSKESVLSKENEDLKQQHSELKKKNESLKARCKVLDNEIVALKTKLSLLKEQSERNQDLITNLTSQMSSFKNSNTDVLAQKERIVKKLQLENDALLKQVGEYKNTVKSLREELDSKNKPTSCSEAEKSDEDIKNETEKINKLFCLLEQQRSLLLSEREAHCRTQTALRVEKQKVAKAEAAAARADLANSCAGSYTSLIVKHSESNLKDRLELAEENVKALQTRLILEQMERQADLEKFRNVLISYGNQNEVSNLEEITC